MLNIFFKKKILNNKKNYSFLKKKKINYFFKKILFKKIFLNFKFKKNFKYYFYVNDSKRILFFKNAVFWKKDNSKKGFFFKKKKINLFNFLKTGYFFLNNLKQFKLRFLIFKNLYPFYYKYMKDFFLKMNIKHIYIIFFLNTRKLLFKKYKSCKKNIKKRLIQKQNKNSNFFIT